MINIKIPSDFMGPVALVRYSGGSYVDGNWVDTAPVGIQIQASVQPLTAGDYRRLPSGNSGLKGWKLFSNFIFDLGEDEVRRPDEMIYHGTSYKLVSIEDWEVNGYSAATFLEVK